MVIGIDGNEANVDKSVGVSVYTQELLKYFASVANKDLQFIVYLRIPKKNHLPRQKKYFKYVVINTPRLWRDLRLPLYLYTHNEIDVLFSPAHYTPRFCPVPVVVTIHDTAYEYFPHEFLKKDLFKLKAWTQHAIKQAKTVIAVSESTKKDIVKNYKITAKDVNIVMNGFKKHHEVRSNKTMTQVMKKYDLKKHEYILYVGTLQPRKNITSLIKSFEQVHKLRPYIKLVIVGRKGWLYHEFFSTAQQLGLQDSILFTGYVPDEDLPHLYRNAGVFVMPSLYEGFGIPLLEAMYYGCPVISSNTSSLPEVGGDAALYFNPRNVKQLTGKIIDVLGKKSLRNKLVNAGKKQYKKFSWKKSASETLQLIEDTVEAETL